MGVKINDAAEFPATTPAATDRVLGIDVSDTSNDPNGEVVTFTISEILAAAGAVVAEGDNISVLTNDAGYITSYTVTEGDVTAHEAALSITESQISDLGAYLTDVTGESIESLSDVNTMTPTDGQVLTWDNGNSRWDAADGGGGGGGLVPISKTTASSDSAIDISLTGGYSAYRIRLEHIRPSVTGRWLQIRTSTDGGTTFDTGASDYTWTYIFADGSTQQADSSGADTIRLALASRADAGTAMSGWLDITPADGTRYTEISANVAMMTSGSVAGVGMGGGVRKNATAVDAVRFYFNFNDVSSGVFHLYGVADGA